MRFSSFLSASSLLFAVIIGRRHDGVALAAFPAESKGSKSKGTKAGSKKSSKGPAVVRPLNLNVNFAFGGARTDSGTFTETSAPDLASCVETVGLELPGLTRQLDWAQGALFDVDPNQDLFWLWAGFNDILNGLVTGSFDPTAAPSNLIDAMERMYEQLGARAIVVPNLLDMGLLPLLVPDVLQLVQGHNAFLQGELAGFETSHPDITIIPVDIFTAFNSVHGDFPDTTGVCYDHSIPNTSPPVSCNEGLLFMDSLHPRSIALEPAATLAFEQINTATTQQWRRIISFGDSYSDVGLYKATIGVCIGNGILPSPPFLEGRFFDGPNLVDQVEALLGTEKTSYFPQPKTTDLVAVFEHPDAPCDPSTECLFGSVMDMSGSFLIPSSFNGPISSENDACLEFEEAAVVCEYEAVDGKSWFKFKRCDNGFTAGDTIDVVNGNVTMLVSGGTFESGDEIEIELFYY